MIQFYTPIHVHSDCSLLDGLSKIEDIVDRIETIESNACAISDHGNIDNSVQFLKLMEESNLKPIIGIEMYICDKDTSIKDETNRSLSHLLLYAKDYLGWKQLVKIVSASNHPDNFYYRPRLSLKQFEDMDHTHIMICTGHLGSSIHKLEFKDQVKHAEYLRELFGKDNFYLESQLCDPDNQEMKALTDTIRSISAKTKIPVVGNSDAHYCNKDDAYQQRILLCRQLNMTLQQMRESGKLSAFFRSNQYHIATYDEMVSYGHTSKELANTNEFADKIGSYKGILKNPCLPSFECPQGYNPDSWLKELCRKGWTQKINPNIPKSEHNIYKDRVLHELKVLEDNSLSSYFLIVGDIMEYCNQQNWLTGAARGSAAGSLVSYLLNITKVNPIRWNLIFERFYNMGRTNSLPDIDCDVETSKRPLIIKYIKDKYGKDKVAQMSTFQRVKGRGALKDVFRAMDLPFEISNEITQYIMDDTKVSSQLQEIKEQTGSSSIIRYTLENDKRELLKKWCYIDKETNEFKGPLSKLFLQACKIEGTKVSRGIHPAGIIIGSESLNEVCPLVLSKDKELVCSFEMGPLEDMGEVKIDLLGLNCLDKIHGVKSILESGDVED